MEDTTPKEALAQELGYGGDLAALDAALQEAGLSRPGKPNISRSKREAVAALIGERFLLVCNRGDCRADARGDDRTVVPAAVPSACEICGGSPVAAALRAMRAACREAGVRRVVVVGGSPMLRARLEREADPPPTLKLVDGTFARTAAQARDDVAWADLIVIWSGSELLHKATMAYPQGHPLLITANRRGIPALARAVEAFARRKKAGSGHHAG